MDRVQVLIIFILLSLPGQGFSHTGWEIRICGTWSHGANPQPLRWSVEPGGGKLKVTANATALILEMQHTKQCRKNSSIPVPQGTGLKPFCLIWDPVLEQLSLNFSGKEFPMNCPISLPKTCCELSPKNNINSEGPYGIVNGSIMGDIIQHHPQKFYMFECSPFECSHLINYRMENLKAEKLDEIEETLMKVEGQVELGEVRGFVTHMKSDSVSQNFTFPALPGAPTHSSPSVFLPNTVRPAGRESATVVCTYYRDAVLFQHGVTGDKQNASIGNDVVGITVRGEVIRDLSEPIRIRFPHQHIPGVEPKCVYWDKRKDHEVRWRDDGCRVDNLREEEVECSCNHLTYFALLLEMQRPAQVHHLKALTWITAMGCAVSIISCIALIFFFFQRRKKIQEQSTPLHCCLTVAVMMLSLLFLVAGVVANLETPSLCQLIGGALHYALLCTLSWMGLEVLHAFWLIYMVFKPPPKHSWLCLAGFGFPALPVFIMLCTRSVYGLYEIAQSDDLQNPYLICWIRESSFLAHYLITVSFSAAVLCAGAVMLFFVHRSINDRMEWREKRLTFLSMWGLSVVFGSTWVLGFLTFDPLTEVVHFLFCIINSLQGCFLLIRFWLLERVRVSSSGRRERCSSSSTGQNMLQVHNSGQSD